MKRAPFLVPVMLLLSGCALPLPVQIALWAADGFSYLGTEKSLSDHGISIATGRDCAVWRVVPEGEICREEAPDTMVAESAPVPTEEPVPSAEELEFATAAGVAASPVAERNPVPVFEAAKPTEVRFGPEKLAEAVPVPPPVPILAVVRDVNLRDRPSGRSRVIRALRRDEVAEALGERDGWVRVRVGASDEGWVDGRFLRTPDDGTG